MKVLFAQGLPASGKTTWSKKFCENNKDWVRVSRDDLRNMRGKYWMPKDEVMITVMERACIRSALTYGKNVIVDAINFNKKFVAHMKYEIDSWGLGVEYETKRFNVSLETAIKRDLKRPNSVGEKVIRKFYDKYIKPDIRIKQDKTLPKAILCDLDGTLAIHKNRYPFEYHKCDTDDVNETVKNILLNNWYYETDEKGKNVRIIFMSGREDSCMEKTIEWIYDKIGLYYCDQYERDQSGDNGQYDIYMRKTGDHRKDSIIKRELFDEYIKGKYYVDFILDDRDQVVEMWRDMGLTCLQVAEGDF